MFDLCAAKLQKNSKTSKYLAGNLQNLAISDGFCTFAAVFIRKRYEITSFNRSRLYSDFCQRYCDVLMQRDAPCYY